MSKIKRTPQEQEILRKGICWDQGKKYTQLSKVPFKDLINWHLGEGATWHFLPIPYEEELANPNYP